MMVRDFPENFTPVSGLEETVLEAEINGFTGFTREILLNGICIEHRDIDHSQPLEILVEHDYPFFKMHFELKGFSGYTRKTKGSHNVTIEEGSHQLFFFPEVKGSLHYNACRRYTLEIKLALPYVTNLFMKDLSILGNFGKAIHCMQPFLVASKCLPILPAMKKVIYEILHCPYCGVLRKIHLEAKVNELLLLQLSQVNEAEELKDTSILKNGDRERIYYVRELIERNIQEPCSILELAEKAGINDFKLKKGFKEIFSTTVFGYMTDVRMEKARNLLVEGKQSIADISFEIGYKNPQHFTAAFKRKFGYLPSALREG